MIKQDKITKISLNIYFLELSEEYPKDSKEKKKKKKKRIRISHGKRVIGVRVIEVRLYMTMETVFSTKVRN